MRTTKEELHHEIAKLAVTICTTYETFDGAFERAARLFRLIQQRETKTVLERLRYVPTCKSEVYDPDMYGFGGCETEETAVDEDEEA